MKSAQDVSRMAASLAGRLTKIRRDLHAHPETAFEETRTARRAAEILRAAGIETRTGVGRTGVVGLLRGARPGRTAALRADMDALPVVEANRAPYRSRNRGAMHACGHDGHCAMLLGAAMILARRRRELAGNVKFLFQPAEEIVSGAPPMIAEGALDRPKADAIFAAHLWPELPFGTVGAAAGARMAAADHFRIVIAGRGGHGAKPELTSDPLVPANHVYQALTALRRRIEAFEPYVLSICSFQAGQTYNVIPETAEMRGTLRTFRPATRRRVMADVERIVRRTAAAFSTEGRVHWDIRCPALVNDAAGVETVKRAAAALGRRCVPDDPTMGSEDFAYYLERIPGAYFRLGTRRRGRPRALHSDRFDFDEAILPLGAAMLAETAEQFLRPIRRIRRVTASRP